MATFTKVPGRQFRLAALDAGEDYNLNRVGNRLGIRKNGRIRTKRCREFVPTLPTRGVQGNADIGTR
jgi:hypothetical protein